MSSAVAQIIAIDFGKKRVGLAVGNTLTKHAEPLVTLNNHSQDDLLLELSKVIKEWQPQQLIMGMPYNPSTEVETSKAQKKWQRRIHNFAALLSETVELPIEFIDESFSSAEASKRLKQQLNLGSRKKRIGKKDIDKEAACIILQRWLDDYT